MRVTVMPDDVHIDARDGETVLAALGRAGFRYRIGCRRGGCGVCKIHLTLGEVRYERPIDAGVLTDDERVAGVCLSCRAVPITNVVVELQEGDRLRRVLPFGFAVAVPAHAEPKRRPGRRGSAGSIPTSQFRAEATSKGMTR